MRSIVLSKSGINKIRNNQFEFKNVDFEGSIKSIPPGEWITANTAQDEHWFGFINPMIEDKYTCSYFLGRKNNTEIHSFSIENFIVECLKAAHSKRSRFQGYESSSRVFYGASDGLPGLIVDQFQNATIVQINTAGIDRYRELIKETLEKLFNKPAHLLDNAKYREKEFLPTFSAEALPDLEVIENGLKYKIRKEVLQKVGFYYDHRENRFHLNTLLSRLINKPKIGLDLFCYAGAWGLTALNAGLEEAHFVDQGELAFEVNEAIKLNGFDGKGTFHRADVFKYLDTVINANKKFDLILCDPPAFAKSALHKPQALEGYSKLHRKVLKSLNSGGVVAFSSCTHYVGHEEFQKNILAAANKENKKLQLVYTGIQGFDHPISSLDDRSSYIKSYFYIVE